MDAQTPSDDPHEFDPELDAYRISCDPTSGESLASRIVLSVSALTGRPPTDLPSLHEHVDPDALDAVFDARTDGTPRRGGRVKFTFCGCAVEVTTGGEVLVRPGEA